MIERVSLSKRVPRRFRIANQEVSTTLRLSVAVPQSTARYLLTRDIRQELLPSLTGELRNPEMLTGRAWCPVLIVSLTLTKGF